MSFRLFYFFLLFLPINLFASEWSALSSLLPKGTQLSYMILDPANNKVIAQSQSSILHTPASIQKLLTATAAKLFLGDKFRYRTMIEGTKEGIKKNQYQGDIRFNFVGDPILSRADIRNMLNALKRSGIKTITGNVLLNQSHFNGYQWSDGQAWNDLGVCYTAPANAIIVNKNCVLGNLRPMSVNSKMARLFIPDYEPIVISSDVSVVTQEERKQQFCALEVTRNSQNHYHLWGCMVPRKQPLALAFAVNDPFVYAQQIIKSELAQIGIKLKGKVLLDNKRETKNASFTDVLASHQSPLLDDLLQIMLKESDNLIADSLFKTLGAAYFQTAGNFRNGAQAVKQILKTHGIDLENAYLADGSGLSRHNLMSAQLFMSVLDYVYKNDAQLKLLSSFAVAGVDGTLKHYKGMRGPLFKGKVRAKTGSMKGVANILGVLKSKQGDRLFVLILNGYNLPDSSVVTEQQKNNKYVFQQAFFEKIMKAL